MPMPAIKKTTAVRNDADDIGFKMPQNLKKVLNGANTTAFKMPEDLRSSMQKALDNPEHLAQLGNIGYLLSEDGQILSKEAHAAAILHRYEQLLSKKVEVMK